MDYYAECTHSDGYSFEVLINIHRRPRIDQSMNAEKHNRIHIDFEDKLQCSEYLLLALNQGRIYLSDFRAILNSQHQYHNHSQNTDLNHYWKAGHSK
jgi:hypothetical protein